MPRTSRPQHVARSLAIAAALVAMPAVAADPRDPARAATAPDALGNVHFPVSCSPAAQRDFDHAIALLHHMTYPQARVAFDALAARAPDCAMAHWGIAM